MGAFLTACAAFMLVAILSATAPTAEQLNERCREHRGVAQVQSQWVAPHDGTVICRDGTALTLNY